MATDHETNAGRAPATLSETRAGDTSQRMPVMQAVSSMSSEPYVATPPPVPVVVNGGGTDAVEHEQTKERVGSVCSNDDDIYGQYQPPAPVHAGYGAAQQPVPRGIEMYMMGNMHNQNQGVLPPPLPQVGFAQNAGPMYGNQNFQETSNRVHSANNGQSEVVQNEEGESDTNETDETDLYYDDRYNGRQVTTL